MARFLASVLASSLAFVTTAHAFASETTVVAPQGSPGVTVVAPTPQGGTVTASGCSAVTVTDSTTIVKEGDPACAPYKPYQPAPPPPPQIIYVNEVRPKFKADAARSTSIVLGAIGHGIGSFYLGGRYIDANEKHYDECAYGNRTPNQPWGSGRDCRANGAFGELIVYGAAMTLLPVIPRFVVGDTKGGLIYGGLIAGSIALAKGLDMNDEKAGRDGVGSYGLLFGYLVPTALGIVALSTTPHREDFEKTHDGPSIERVAPIPLANAHGTHGAALSLEGAF